MTAFPRQQTAYITPSPSLPPPNPHLSRKPIFVRQPYTSSPPASPKFITRPIPPCYYDCTNTSFIPPLDIPSALKAAENLKGKEGRNKSKEKAKREELGLKVEPPTPTTRKYMRKALLPVPGQPSQSTPRTASGRVEKSRKEEKGHQPPSHQKAFKFEAARGAPAAPAPVNQLRGYKIDTPHPRKMSTRGTADDYLAAKTRRRAERDRSEAMELAGFPYVVDGGRR